MRKSWFKMTLAAVLVIPANSVCGNGASTGHSQAPARFPSVMAIAIQNHVRDLLPAAASPAYQADQLFGHAKMLLTRPSQTPVERAAAAVVLEHLRSPNKMQEVQERLVFLEATEVAKELLTLHSYFHEKLSRLTAVDRQRYQERLDHLQRDLPNLNASNNDGLQAHQELGRFFDKRNSGHRTSAAAPVPASEPQQQRARLLPWKKDSSPAAPLLPLVDGKDSRVDGKDSRVDWPASLRRGLAAGLIGTLAAGSLMSLISYVAPGKLQGPAAIASFVLYLGAVLALWMLSQGRSWQ